MFLQVSKEDRQAVLGLSLKTMLLARCGSSACTECCVTSCTRCG